MNNILPFPLSFGRLALIAAAFCSFTTLCAQKAVPVKPRVLISTDIGGTDPDDNQSMAHLMMYSDRFRLEGLVSSPSYGSGNKEELLRMIGLYAQDFPRLRQQAPDLMTPDALRALCKQGRKGAAPYAGYRTATEGSEWIVQCARRQSDQPLWILVWGGLDDVAQALHDAPDILPRIRVYWIGGPNKKWSTNSYAYLAANFPNLWMIENNASYRGFIADNELEPAWLVGTQAYDKAAHESNATYYEACIKGCGHLGADFAHYYKGNIKMGDTPSLLYLMDGNPADPGRESWGGSFEAMRFSPRSVFHRNLTVRDTVAVYSLIELHFKGEEIDRPVGTPCFVMTVAKQQWEGVYAGQGDYVIRYAAKTPEVLDYTIASDYAFLNGQHGTFVVGRQWPGKRTPDSYELGNHWVTDRQDAELFDGLWQGSRTVSKWRDEVLKDWAKRWNWLR
ncbi:MAG: DUF1593 domain-containing protein [Prevotellaceae bacterium]|jgi:hypothetical protein|nr:DUF1593 domain-containing protein [Prevotellaceae bacterium]